MKSWNSEKVHKGDILLSCSVSVSITSVPRILRQLIHLGSFSQYRVLENEKGLHLQILD